MGLIERFRQASPESRDANFSRKELSQEDREQSAKQLLGSFKDYLDVRTPPTTQTILPGFEREIAIRQEPRSFQHQVTIGEYTWEVTYKELPYEENLSIKKGNKDCTYFSECASVYVEDPTLKRSPLRNPSGIFIDEVQLGKSDEMPLYYKINANTRSAVDKAQELIDEYVQASITNF